MQKFTIVEARQVRTLDPANASGYDTLVTYTDEAKRLHVITVDGAAPTLDEIRQAISAQHAQRTQHSGKVIEA